MDPLELSSIPDYAPMTGIAAETYEDPLPDEPGLPDIKGQEVTADDLKQDDDNLDDMSGGERQDKSKKEVETPPGEAPKPTESEKPKEAVQQSAADLALLEKACKAFGITETDPLKQAQAIDDHIARMDSEREQTAAQAEAARVAKADEQFTKQATQATHAEIMARMAADGWATDVENPWSAATWADTENPDYGAEMLSAYREYQKSPLVEAYFNTQLNTAKSAYEAQNTAVTETLAKYPNHAPDVVALMRDNNVDIKYIDQVARFTHEHTQKAIATTHSALAAEQAKVATLEAQISGHDAALKAAVADERKRILAEMGRPNPASGGTGGPSPTETGAYKSEGIGRGIWNRIPVMK